LTDIELGFYTSIKRNIHAKGLDMKLKCFLAAALAVLLLMSTAWCANLSVVVQDSIAVADTVIDTPIADTVYSNPLDVRGVNRLHFATTVVAVDNGAAGAYTNDKFYFWLQYSFDRTNWYTSRCIDSALGDVGATAPAVNHAATDSVFGDWIRLMAIHADSTRVSWIDSLDNTYYWGYNLWVAFKD
jgi:hypothetical protein